MSTRQPREKIRGAEGPPISATVYASRVDMLYALNSSIVIGAIATVGVSLVCYAQSGAPWLIVWTMFVVLVMVARLCLAWAYDRREPGADPKRWAVRFTIGAAVNAFLWGCASGLSVYEGNPFVMVGIISAQSAYVIASTVRNNAIPAAAVFQVCFPYGLLSVGCLATGDHFYMMFALFIWVFMVGAIQVVHALSRKTTDLLVADERAAQANDDLARANAKLEALATTDALTGVANRRGFDNALAHQCEIAIAEQHDVSLLLLDIDYFKALNDAFGHPAGDACLCRIADCLRQTITRPGDLVARYGGEEFAVVLSNTNHVGAGMVAERVRAAVQALAVVHPTSQTRTTTISVGYATVRPDAMTGTAAVIQMADDALYRAKAGGRNRIAGSVSASQPGRPHLVAVSV